MNIPRNKNGNVTMNDVAAYAKVSQATVSRVINNHPGINAATREQVLSAMRRLNYRNLGAEETGKRLRIALLMCPLPEQKNPFDLDFFMQIVGGIQEVFATENVDMTLQTLAPGASDLEIPETDAPEGFIILNHPAAELLENLRKRNFKFVVATILPGIALDHDVIEADHINACRKICRFLVDRKITRFALFNPECFYNCGATFQIEMMQCGHPLSPEDIYTLKSTDDSAFIEAIHACLKKGDLPPAMVVRLPSAAQAIAAVLKANHIRVPEDVEIYTFTHDSRPVEFPAMVEFPRLQGIKSARRLLEKIRHGDDTAHRISIPVIFQLPGAAENPAEAPSRLCF